MFYDTTCLYIRSSWLINKSPEKNNVKKYNKLLREVGMAIPKTKGTRVGWLVTNVVEYPCYIVLATEMKGCMGQHQNGVAEDAPLH